MSKEKEINDLIDLIDMCENFDIFTKDEIIKDYEDDLQLLYIYYYVKSAYGDKDFYLYYKKSFDTNADLEIDMFVVMLDDYTIRYIEMTDKITVYYNTDDIKIAKAELNRYY